MELLPSESNRAKNLSAKNDYNNIREREKKYCSLVDQYSSIISGGIIKGFDDQ